MTLWTDKSTHGRNASAVSTKGPQCDAALVNGKRVLSFTRPTAFAPYDDETLAVDLGFLVGTPFTILVVEQVEAVDSARHGVLGTRIPGENTADQTLANRALHFGYETPATPALTLDQNDSFQGSVAVTVPAPNPSSTWCGFDGSVGHRVYRNGILAFERTDAAAKAALVEAASGAIGRSLLYATVDSRYHGTIVEDVMYDSALSNGDLGKLTTYAKTHWTLAF